MAEGMIALFPLLITVFVYVVIIIIFLENRSPHRTLFWLLILAFFPLVGLFFYMYFGRSAAKYKFFLKMGHAEIPQIKKKIKTLEDKYIQELFSNDKTKEIKRLARIITANSPSYVTFNNCSRIINNGTEKFAALFHYIQEAKHHIHLEYFIIRDDYTGNKLKDMLIEKARQGVQVRFLYDGLGSRKLGKKYIKALRQGGVKTAAFLPFKLPIPSTWMNYRNHRKIAIIDGEVGLIGGMNIGDEYITGGDLFSSWRDTQIEIKGDALDLLQGIFISDWTFTTGEEILATGYFPLREDLPGQAIQIAASGPDGNSQSIHHAYFTAIATAKKHIYIVTPYLIPDEAIATALKAAALSGVDVRIIFPGNPDHRVVNWASFSYFSELLEAGVKIYLYQKGFIHSKTLTVDGVVAVVGTANMDMRSFYYSFEINAFIYDREMALNLEKDFFEDLSFSFQVDPEEFCRRPYYTRLKESAARLLSPLL